MWGKKSGLLLIGICVILLVTLLFIKYQTPEKSPYLELNAEQIRCYTDSLYSIFTSANITSTKLNVQRVRCAREGSSEQQIPISQLEMSGTYFEDDDHSQEPKSFYFHEITGGMAASGADEYYEVCLLIDGKPIISKIETGRNLEYRSPARCGWQLKLP